MLTILENELRAFRNRDFRSDYIVHLLENEQLIFRRRLGHAIMEGDGSGYIFQTAPSVCRSGDKLNDINGILKNVDSYSHCVLCPPVYSGTTAVWTEELDA